MTNQPCRIGTRRSASSQRPRLRASGVAALALLGSVAPVAGQLCEAGHQPRAHLGVGIFHCQGGSCLAGGARSTMDTRFPDALRAAAEADPHAFYFTVEPVLYDVNPTGPSAGHVEDGDALVAVNGDPITTASGSRHLTRMKAGEPIRLTLRRRGRVFDVSLTPEKRCGSYRASAGPDPRPWSYDPDRRNAPLSPPSLDETSPVLRLVAAGLVLVGTREMRVDLDGTVTWWFRSVPTVAEVVDGSPAAAAGILPGEQIVQVERDWVTRATGAAALESLGHDGSLRVMVRRGNAAREVRINAR